MENRLDKRHKTAKSWSYFNNRLNSIKWWKWGATKRTTDPRLSSERSSKTFVKNPSLGVGFQFKSNFKDGGIQRDILDATDSVHAVVWQILPRHTLPLLQVIQVLPRHTLPLHTLSLFQTRSSLVTPQRCLNFPF